MTLTVTGTDALLLPSLGLMVLSGWLVVIWGFDLAEWTVYALIVAGGVELLFHPGALSGAGPGLMIAGFLLVGAGLGLRRLTIHQLSKLRAAGRFRELNWREVAALLLWIAGAGCAMTVIHPVFGVALVAGVAIWLGFALRPEAREVRTHISIEIRCDPETAFSVVGNPRKSSLYTDDLEIDAPADKQVGPGYRYRWRLRLKDGYVFEDEGEVIEYQPGHRIKERSLRHPPSSGTCTVELAPGGTRVIYDYEGMLSVPQALLGLRPAVVTTLTATRQRICAALKELLEEPAA
ncbi:MAG: hypothetical protein M3Z28_13110 [Candidatus Dormibacteraeota bacterium]|nr:hypothetical protein [Candidatus Dormibacteraeota bacterium]